MRKKADYMIFIDDDEMPYKENWLELMIESIEKFKKVPNCREFVFFTLLIRGCGFGGYFCPIFYVFFMP